MSFFSGSAMSKRSTEFRKKAAFELRKSRNGGSEGSKADNRKRAAAFKVLARNEEWLDGEKERPKTERIRRSSDHKLEGDNCRVTTGRR